MASNKSKQKGNTYERQVASHLSHLFSDSFIRVPNSGAYVGGKNSSRRDTMTDAQVTTFRGDIIPPDNYNLVIECKNYKSIPGGMIGLLSGQSLKIDLWLKELRGDAGELVRSDVLDFYMLFIKLTRQGEWVITPDLSKYCDFHLIPHMVYYYDQIHKHTVISIKYLDKLKSTIKNIVAD